MQAALPALTSCPVKFCFIGVPAPLCSCSFSTHVCAAQLGNAPQAQELQRLRCCAGLATGRWGETQRKGAAPRPPQLHRRHEPCTQTNPLSPPDFVEHLRTINWYKQQVQLQCAAGVLCMYPQTPLRQRQPLGHPESC